jgi:hypothetical protein
VSLLETILALALLGMALTSMARLLVEATATLERAREAAETLAAASALQEVLRTVPVEHPWLVSGGSLHLGRVEAEWRVRRLAGLEDLLLVEIEATARRGPRGRSAALSLRCARPSW